MSVHEKNSIIRNFPLLINDCDVAGLKEQLIANGFFKEEETRELFTEDEKHNKRLFFFALRRKGPQAFEILLKYLRETRQDYIARVLEENRGAVPYAFPSRKENAVRSIEDNYQNDIPVNLSSTPLKISVKMSDRFYDTEEHNKSLPFYNTRSKNRGYVLIINNYDFDFNQYEYRRGADVDERNCISLFQKMGFNVKSYSNLRTEQMEKTYKEFAKTCSDMGGDIFIIITMSHGVQYNNETWVMGKDNVGLETTRIENYFNNRECPNLESKPKIFLYQVCRGTDLDMVTYTTQTDGCPLQETTPVALSILKKPVRRVEDMLIGYGTLQGFKVHRDPRLGSWYIEQICQEFMDHAYNTSVDDLLIMVDRQLRKRMSEFYSMQTSDIGNKGFHKCYLHPGIYEENNAIKRFDGSKL